MTTRDTQDIIMGKIIDIEQMTDENHKIVMKSLEVVSEIITNLNSRISDLETKMKG